MKKIRNKQKCRPPLIDEMFFKRLREERAKEAARLAVERAIKAARIEGAILLAASSEVCKLPKGHDVIRL